MTDFYALLKQSILDRGIRDPDDRQEVYSQARRAVIKQLWDFRPPLAADEIDMRVGAYDTAVERIEAELRQVFAKATGTHGAARPKAAPARRPAAEPARTAAYANGRGQSTALAEWAREQPEYAPGVQRAVTAYVPPPTETEAANDDFADDEIADYEDEAEADYEDEAPEPRRAAHQRPRIDRWSATAARQVIPIKFDLADWFGWLGSGEEIKVRLLAIAVGALFVLLVGVGAFILGARTSNQTAGPGSDVRTEVSDAATAARIPNDKVQVLASYALFDGRDPRVFATTPDNPVYFDDADGFARITSSTTASGVKTIIGPGLAARLAGQNVRVVITARASVEGGAAGMRFAYQSGLAISHWQTANLSANYVQLGMEWRVPTMRTNPAGDALIIEPGIPGDGTGVDIKSIRIDVLAS